ncbi:hypothetical protein G9G63_20245 [Paenibacillus sp. EKM202P]|uniref:hypothetical protein n=1 Tax=unclassified Paenibacillus TaxID=185978 RepID=UPI0013ED4CDB|nr:MULTISPECIES: hypothetical protein [unclassified Paenibacillus]KAF6561985.1 hypothetical protein G9G63_20245 [Paenibacillus sp. EKM202P]KAF6566273.1 hypothetical protein G9G64_19380 [Paenibacillus sp. EKM207P]
MTEDLNKRNKQEWIESAAVLKAEPYEIAGALFDCATDALLSRAEVEQRLVVYLHPVKEAPASAPVKPEVPQVKKAKEETLNDNSEG